MEENINKVYDNIIKCTDDINDIINSLKELKGDLISIGTGGSRVVAEYASKVISKINNINSITLDPRDLSYIDKSKYKNIFISSYSGSNFGVKESLDNELNHYLLSSRKTEIKNEILLHYEMPSEDSFISINATIIPMAILLKYYLKDKFRKIIDKIFDNIDKNMYIDLNENIINIFTGIDTKVTYTFLESSLIESGLLIPIPHEKYSYCHGRSTINKNKDYSSIYLGNNNTDLDKLLAETMKLDEKKILIIDSKYEDDVINEFYLTIQCLYLLKNIAKKRKINLSKINYDKEAVKKLYYFKGSM